MVHAQHLIQLSFSMSPDSPVPPAIQSMQITPRMQLAHGDEANVYRVAFDNHSNTHVDAPAHVIAGGLRITEMNLADFVFDNPAVIDLPLPDKTVVEPAQLEPILPAMQGADLVLFRFGYGEVRRTEPERYVDQCPGFGVAGARYLRSQLPALRAVGMDVPSFVCIDTIEETMVAHNVMLEGDGRRFLLIEDMDLEHNLAHLSQVLLVPWLVDSIDSAPCSVLGLLSV